MAASQAAGIRANHFANLVDRTLHVQMPPGALTPGSFSKRWAATRSLHLSTQCVYGRLHHLGLHMNEANSSILCFQVCFHQSQHASSLSFQVTIVFQPP